MPEYLPLGPGSSKWKWFGYLTLKIVQNYLVMTIYSTLVHGEDIAGIHRYIIFKLEVIYNPILVHWAELGGNTVTLGQKLANRIANFFPLQKNCSLKMQ